MSATLARRSRSARIPAPLLALALGTMLLGLVFRQECTTAVAVWIASTAYGHCFLVAPMAAYLAWDRRAALRGQAARPWPAAGLLALPVAVAWLAAERLGIMEGRQLMAVAAFEVLALAVLGWRLYRLLAAPLLYLVFLVPFGAFLTPALQSFTARFVGIGLDLLGIPNLITEFTIEIPQGTFYVAQACAGLRFLIAAVAFGVFYALLNYRSPGRRLVFIAASVAVPVVANGFRALGIVVLGNLLGSAEAAATDHVLYGWLFFSIVLLLLVVAGLPLREPPCTDAPPETRPTPPGSHGAVLAASCAILLAAIGPAGASLLDHAAAGAQLASTPAFLAAPGCVAGPAGRETAARWVAHFTCAGSPLLVTAEAQPTRATPDRILHAERALAGEEVADDASYGALRLARGPAHDWLLVETTDPAQTTALAVWIDGQPSPGGLRTRLRQAWASIAGAAHPPVVVAVALPAATTRLTPEAASAARALLAAFLEAQPAF